MARAVSLWGTAERRGPFQRIIRPWCHIVSSQKCAQILFLIYIVLIFFILLIFVLYTITTWFYSALLRTSCSQGVTFYYNYSLYNLPLHIVRSYYNSTIELLEKLRLRIQIVSSYHKTSQTHYSNHLQQYIELRHIMVRDYHYGTSVKMPNSSHSDDLTLN